MGGLFSIYREVKEIKVILLYNIDVRLQVHFEWKLQFEFGNYKTIMHNVRQTIIWKK